jgi:hypothetical protein
MNHDERGHWYLLTGVMIGIFLGLLYTWLVQPVEYIDTSPASLHIAFKDSYRAMIALAYVGNPDLVRAKARLALLEDADIYRVLSEQAQKTLAENGSPNEARALGLLAVALGSRNPPPITPFSQEIVISPVISRTPNITREMNSTITLETTPSLTDLIPMDTLITTQETEQTPIEAITTATSSVISSTLINTPVKEITPVVLQTTQNSFTPTTKPSPNTFVLESLEKICDLPLDAPLFQIEVVDSSGDPFPGVLIIINWDSGEDRFFTGLKPEKGLGYADYSPSPEKIYMIRLGENGQPVYDLVAPECVNSYGESFWGAWLLVFSQN